VAVNAWNRVSGSEDGGAAGDIYLKYRLRQGAKVIMLVGKAVSGIGAVGVPVEE
jgi:hypothetical protein